MLKQLNQPLNKKLFLKTAGIICLALMAGWGVFFAFTQIKNTLWYKKYEIRSYLKKNALKNDFKADFDFDIKATIASLKNDISNLTNQIYLANSNVTVLKDRLANLKKERNDLQDKLSRLKSKTSSLEEELLSAQRRLTNRQDEVALARSNVLAKTAAVNDLRQKLDALTRKASALTNEINEAKNNLVKLKDKLSEAKTNQTATVAELKQKSRLLPDNEKNLSRLEKELQAIEGEISKNQESLTNAIEQKKSVSNEKEIAELDRKIQSYSAKMESLKTNRQDKIVLIEAEKKKLFETQNAITNLTNLSTNWQNRIDAFQQEIDSISKTIQAKENELSNLKREIYNLSQTIAERENSLKNSTANLLTLETNLFNLKTNIAGLTENARKNRLEMLEIGRQIARNEKNQLQTQDESKKLISSIDEMRKKLIDLQRQLAQKEQEEKNQYAIFSRNMTRKMNEASSYTALYQIIGQQLWVTDRLLDAEPIEKKQTGVKIAYDAMRCALDYAENFWLASRITEAYLFPNINLFKQSDQDKSFLDQMLVYSARAFQNADETNGLIQAYQLQINNAINENRANYARYYLSSIHEQLGDIEKAIFYLKQITDQTNFAYAVRRVQFLQSRLEKLQGKKQQ